MISGVVVFRARYDLDGYCTESERESVHIEERAILLSASRWEEPEASLFSTTKLESFMTEDGEIDL